MILIFDMDDTLYDEREYVESGLRSVANFGYKSFGWSSKKSFQFMLKVLDTKGRGNIFDLWLKQHKKHSKLLAKKCIFIYRHHDPKLKLYTEARHNFSSWRNYPLYLVTDGHKIVQDKKVKALGLYRKFKKVYITHRYGIDKVKPSLHCFKLIKNNENCQWEDMIYVGDNPSKDFINLNKVGSQTVRVKTGFNKDVRAKRGHDAKWVIKDLSELNEVLEKIKKCLHKVSS